jgi:hypothetical protein
MPGFIRSHIDAIIGKRHYQRSRKINVRVTNVTRLYFAVFAGSDWNSAALEPSGRQRMLPPDLELIDP